MRLKAVKKNNKIQGNEGENIQQMQVDFMKSSSAWMGDDTFVK